MSLDLRPSLDAAFRAFGIDDATVTPPGGPSVTAVVLWLPPVTVENPQAAEYRRAEARRVLALKVSEVPQVPRGTTIVVAEQTGLADATWSVDETERVDPDHWRVMVVPFVEEDS